MVLIKGRFDIDMNPLEPYFKGENGIKLGRFSMDKVYHGELEAVGTGEMISAMTLVENSAGYTAIEQVRGSLKGKKGSFVLQHYGLMDHGEDSLILKVVPDSGTDELQGLIGTMAIVIKDGLHYYEFEYTL